MDVSSIFCGHPPQKKQIPEIIDDHSYSQEMYMKLYDSTVSLQNVSDLYPSKGAKIILLLFGNLLLSERPHR